MYIEIIFVMCETRVWIRALLALGILSQQFVYRMHMQMRGIPISSANGMADNAKIPEIMRRWHPFHGI